MYYFSHLTIEKLRVRSPYGQALRKQQGNLFSLSEASCVSPMSLAQVSPALGLFWFGLIYI